MHCYWLTRRFVSLFVLAGLIVWTVTGCGKQSADRPAPMPSPTEESPDEPAEDPAPDKPPAEEKPEESDAEPMTETEDPDAVKPDGEASTEEASPDAIAVEEAEPMEPAAPEVPPQKLIVFTTNGPIRVDVRLWIDNAPFDQALEELVDHVLTLADTDKDGTATWEELADQPDLKSGQFGNLSFEDPRERQRLINQYDTNRNGWVDRSEVPRLVSRNRNNSEAFSVRQTSYAAERSRGDSPLRQLIDESGDGTIQKEEIFSAAKRLRLYDFDDDEIVTPMELMTTLGINMNNMTGQARDRRRFFGSQAMFTLDDSTPWDEVLYAMEQNYEHGAPLKMARFPEDNLLHKIDADQNGRLSREELMSMSQIDPQMTLDVRFGQRDEGVKHLTLSQMNAAKGESPLEDDQEVSLDLGSDWLVFRARDSVDTASVKPQAENLLQIYDGNQNNYLEPDEIPEGAQQNLDFASADKDGNEMLFVEEIEAYLLQRNWVRRCQIRLQGIEGDDPLMRVIDPNHDRRLSARELISLEEQLAAVDANDSESIEFDEIPALLVFEFFRGDQDQAPQPAQIYQEGYAAGITNANAPAWFTGMDFNGDGDISRREFLGTPSQFDELDIDDDGFLTSGEVAPPEADPAAEPESDQPPADAKPDENASQDVAAAQ